VAAGTIEPIKALIFDNPNVKFSKKGVYTRGECVNRNN